MRRQTLSRVLGFTYGGSININDILTVPIWHKICLTFKEASLYSNISEGKLREIAQRPNCPFILHKASHILIKREKFEKWIQEQTKI